MKILDGFNTIKKNLVIKKICKLVLLNQISLDQTPREAMAQSQVLVMLEIFQQESHKSLKTAVAMTINTIILKLIKINMYLQETIS